MLTEIGPGISINLSMVSAVREANNGASCVIVADGYAHACDRAYHEVLAEVQAAQSPTPPATSILSNTVVGNIVND